MRYTISNDRIKFEADSLGAEPMSIQTVQAPVEFLWQGDPKYWGRHAPVLFPIVGALKNNRYLLNGREYEMGQHGFARDSEFEMIKATGNSLTFLLKENTQTLKNFPFSFELYTTYTLQANEIQIHHRVVNSADGTMWFSIGDHPGFNCPLLAGEIMEDYSLVFETDECLERRLLENGLLTQRKDPFLLNEKTIPLSKDLFAGGAVILENFKSRSLSLVSRNHPRKITVSIDGYPYLGIWSPTKGAPFVCVEPWHGIASPEDSDGDITHKPGILFLNPGKTFHCGYKIIIE